MILTAKGSIMELKSELDRFLNKNKGSVFTLNNFKFVKPNEDKEGPGKKVEVYWPIRLVDEIAYIDYPVLLFNIFALKFEWDGLR